MSQLTTLCLAALSAISSVSSAAADPEFELAFSSVVPAYVGIKDVALIPRGDIAVGFFTMSDASLVRMFAFNQSGILGGSLFAEFPQRVTGLATNADRSHVYVLEERFGGSGVVIHVLNTDGLPLMDIVPAGAPVFGTGLDCDRYGNVFLTDPDMDRVLVFDESWFAPVNYGMSHIALPDRTIGPLLYDDVVDVSMDFWGAAHISFGGGEVAVYDASGALWSLGGTGGIALATSAAGIDAHTFQPGTLAPSTWISAPTLREIDWDLADGTPSSGQVLPVESNGVESITLHTDSGPVDMLVFGSAWGIFGYRR